MVAFVYAVLYKHASLVSKGMVLATAVNTTTIRLHDVRYLTDVRDRGRENERYINDERGRDKT